jgi:dTDP-4-amino-4,6-dideoxygalactose transaminase
LRVKLRRLADWTTARRRIASAYHKGLTSVGLELPSEAAKARHVYHLFTVRHPQRNALAKLLTDDGISTAIYYPRSVPDQPMFGAGAERRWPEAWRASREVLSLPCFAELTDDEVDRVVAGVRSACERL